MSVSEVITLIINATLVYIINIYGDLPLLLNTNNFQW